MSRTRIKICGITRAEDAADAVAAGADALGFVFYEPSPRYVSPAQAAVLIAAVPAFVTTVALFVNAEAELIRQVVAQTRIDLIQFHGDEAPAFCEQFDRPYIKALRMKPGTDVAAACRQYASAAGILLDAYRPGVPGGTGEAFDWERIPAARPLPLILAGGLTPEHIAAAVAQVRPYAVDVSGGVEQTKGIKNRDKIRTFIQEVSRVDQT